jgi:hypothetical protein
LTLALLPRHVTFGAPQDAGRPGRWLTLSTSSGMTRPFALPADAHGPALSPDGQMIAFDDGNGAEPTVYVFDVRNGTTRRLARRSVAPIWLAPDLIAATTAGLCLPISFCVVPWLPMGTTIGPDARTGESRPLQLPTTLQEQLIYGVIDTSGDIPVP